MRKAMRKRIEIKEIPAITKVSIGNSIDTSQHGRSYRNEDGNGTPQERLRWAMNEYRKLCLLNKIALF